MLAQELEKNSHTETPLKNPFSQLLEKKSDEHKKTDDFSNFSQIYDKKNTEVFDEYKKIIGIG